MSTEGWKVTMVHGPKSKDVETLGTLYAAMEWARLKAAAEYACGLDCLGKMQKVFVLEPEDGMWFQYGMNYHWVTFERI